jgi:hypothetical protein
MFSQEEINNKTSDYICFDCGKLFLTEEQKKEEKIVTANLGFCCLCGENKLLSSIRHFNWLNLEYGTT